MSLGGNKAKGGRLGGSQPRGGKLRKDGARVGDRLETELAEDLQHLGARKQAGSGSYAGRKGDIDIPEPETLLIEAKEITGRRENPVEITQWLRKITREARGKRKKPCLMVGFPDMGGPVPKKWAMLPVELFRRLILSAGWEGFEE